MAEGHSRDNAPKKRGPYKKYLRDSNEVVPKSTKYYRIKRNKTNLNEIVDSESSSSDSESSPSDSEGSPSDSSMTKKLFYTFTGNNESIAHNVEISKGEACSKINNVPENHTCDNIQEHLSNTLSNNSASDYNQESTENNVLNDYEDDFHTMHVSDDSETAYLSENNYSDTSENNYSDTASDCFDANYIYHLHGLDDSEKSNDSEWYENDFEDEEDENESSNSTDEASQASDMTQVTESLYNNSNVSRPEAELLIMALALRHHLPDICLENLLGLLDCILPQEVFKSKYLFLKKFSNNNQFIDYYYCPDCKDILNFDVIHKVKTRKTQETTCEHCNKKYNMQFLRENHYFFIYIPLKQQLIDLVKTEVYTKFRNVSEDESDVINGDYYKKLRQDGVIRDQDITIQWNTDGVKLFVSSKFSLWGIQVAINDLPYRLRKNNILLCGVWCNNEKPPMNMFLKPFMEELRELSTDGFETNTYSHEQTINIKVHTLFAPVDSVARPQIQCMHQFNGTYGCPYCLHKGESVEVGRGFSRVYCGPMKTLRTSEQHFEHAEEAHETKKVVKGVKNVSVMMLLPHCDIIDGYPPEYMHSCLLGVGKLFITAWFNSAYNDEEWYLGNNVKDYDRKLLSFKPPCEITRVPKSISEKHFKANDWKYQILYYSLPIINSLMPQKFVKHWFLFVYSLSIFLKKNINDQQFELASEALNRFVSNIEPLYGKQFMKFNVHILLHIPRFVKLYGTLWSWSAFIFEHYNGVLKSLFHGTQCVPDQIVKAHSRLRTIKINSNVFGNENCDPKSKKLFISFMNQCRVANCIEYDEHLRIFGTGKPINLSATEKLVIEQKLGNNINKRVMTFKRFIFKHVLFHCSNYKRLKKRNNSCIMLTDGSIVVIIKLVEIRDQINDQNVYLLIGQELPIIRNLIKVDRFSSNEFCFVTEGLSRTVCFEMNDIKCKCICLEYDEYFYIFPLGNNIETD